MNAASFIRWNDGSPQGPPIADILRSRPGAWAVVDEKIGGYELEYRLGCVALDPDEGFEVRQALRAAARRKESPGRTRVAPGIGRASGLARDPVPPICPMISAVHQAIPA